jgi:YHS domain-containing protein
MSSIFKSSLAVAFVFGFATTAYAATGEFGNQCSWGLANHQHVQTDCTISSPYRGRTYCFGSSEAQANFMKHPHKNLAKAESFYKSEHKG